MAERDWSKELAKIDKQLEGISDEELAPKPVPVSDERGKLPGQSPMELRAAWSSRKCVAPFPLSDLYLRAGYEFLQLSLHYRLRIGKNQYNQQDQRKGQIGDQ